MDHPELGKLFLKHTHVLDRKLPMRKLWLISLGGSSVWSWDFCLGLESELLSGWFFFAWFCWSRRPSGFHSILGSWLPQFTPKVYVHMGHGYEIIENGCATSWTNTCKVHKRGSKKTGCQVPFTNATRGPEMISPNSFCVIIYLHQAHIYEFRPTIPIQPSEQKWRNQFDLLLGNGWVLHKILKWYLPIDSVALSSQGP